MFLENRQYNVIILARSKIKYAIFTTGYTRLLIFFIAHVAKLHRNWAPFRIRPAEIQNLYLTIDFASCASFTSFEHAVVSCMLSDPDD